MTKITISNTSGVIAELEEPVEFSRFIEFIEETNPFLSTLRLELHKFHSKEIDEVGYFGYVVKRVAR